MLAGGSEFSIKSGFVFVEVLKKYVVKPKNSMHVM